MDKDPRRGESKRQGQSRKQARRNRHMRGVLYVALERLFDECLQTGWFGEIALHARVQDGVLQREYSSSMKRRLRMT